MDFISNKIDFEFYDLGEQKIKNTNIHAFDLLDPKLKKRVIETIQLLNLMRARP